MPGLLFISAACASLFCGPAGQETHQMQAEAADPTVEEAAALEPAVLKPTPEQSIGPSEATLLEFDGEYEFLTISRRLRIWRPEVAFEMEVGPDGRPTDCRVVNKFRKNFVNLQLCKVLMEHHTFEPARDAENMAVAGTYRSKLAYMDLRKKYD